METFETNRTLEPTVSGAVLRYRWFVLLITALSVGAAYYFATSTYVERYEAQATMSVQDPTATVLFDSGGAIRRTDYVSDQIEILRSSEIANRAAALASGVDGVDLTAFDIAAGLSVSNSQGSSLIFIALRGDTPLEATAGANAIVVAYRNLLKEEFQTTFADSVEVLDDRVEVLNKEIAANQRKIAQITVLPNNQTRELETFLANSVPRLITLYDAILAEPDLELKAELRQQVGDINGQISTIASIQGLTPTDPELVDLLQEQSRLIDRTQALEERRETREIDRLLLGDGVTIATKAEGARQIPSNETRLGVLGGLIGFVLAATLAYSLTLRNRVFSDKNEPERVLNAPLIAEIPNFRHEGIKSGLPVRAAPRSASAESFRFAAAALDARMNADPSDHGLILGVTSSSVSEGKTVVAVNTAVAAAREGKRVLLIDADFGNQATTAMLLPDTPPELGITEVVEGGSAMRDAAVTIEGDGQSGLHLLARGWRETTAPEFFRLPATKAFLKRVAEHYDLIVVDAPPLLQVAYASTILSIAEKVLIVVPHRSSVSNLTELEDRLELIGSPLMGYVYNMAPLNLGMTLTEGSMKDVLGTDEAEPSRS